MKRYFQNATTTNTALLRTVAHINYTYGRCPAYRRLASSLLRGVQRNEQGVFFQGTSSAASWQLPCQFLPLEMRLAPIAAVQSRQIHISSIRRGRDGHQPKTKSNTAGGQANKQPTGKEAKSPQGNKSANKDGKQQDGKQPDGKQDDGKQEDGKQEDGKQEDGKQDDGKQEDGKQDDGKQEDGKQEDGKQEDGKQQKDDLPPPPPHGDKTPWQVFMETMNTEFQKSKEWNESTKQIGAAAHQFTESESVRRAREAYEKSTGAVSSTASKAVKSTAGAIGKGATWTWETPVMKGVRKAANATGDAVDRATKPIRDTETYKNVKEVIDDGSSSRYGGWVDKEERRKRRAEIDAQRGKGPEKMEEDPNAGTNVTLHKDAAWKEAWRDFRDTNRLMQGLSSMKSSYAESENPLISTARSITDRIGGFFAENETAIVIKKFRAMDPAFQLEPFLKDLREYMLPEVLEAYVKGDLETLQQWLSAAQYSVYEALTKQYRQAGMRSDGEILDIRNVDILRARMLEPGDVPVFIVTCRTQEVHVYRNAKTGQLAAGMEDKVQLVTYAIGMTRTPEDVNNAETRGWRLIEMQKSGRDWY